jgi:hypothetical protein
LARRFDLAKESRKFKDELDELLNCTVCTGISLNSVVTSDSPQRTVVGYKITRDNQDVTEGIPVTINDSDPQFHLGLSIRLAPDEQQTSLMVTSSVMILSTAADVADEANILLHYDYERGKHERDDYPEAHLQICASSDAWRAAGKRLGGKERLLERLHLPVGDRRFRPTLEDLIEFLIREKLAKSQPAWKAAIAKGRSRFQDKQLRAAVRRQPETAISELEKLDYTVKAPRRKPTKSRAQDR